MKHLIGIHELDARTVDDLVDLAADVKRRPAAYGDALPRHTLAMVFQKPSTRTRVSFEAGIQQLGGHGIFLSARDIQLARGEPIGDTAQVLSRYCDGLMARTHAHDDVVQLAEHATVPVINGLTDLLHPCQALSDLLTLRQHLGSLRGRRLAYVGDGNNVAHSLMFACAKAGLDFACATPEGYAMDPDQVALGRADAEAAGTRLVETTDPVEAVAGADAVYTDVWASMGQDEEADARQRALAPYAVDRALMEQASPDAVFMHCLPAHRGEEVTAEVADGPQSVIFDQAENRLHLQKALMLRLMAPSAPESR